jgi:hypothetical protein
MTVDENKMFTWLFMKKINIIYNTTQVFFRRDVNFAIFGQTVRVGSNFAKIGKSKIKNFTISALS